MCNMRDPLCLLQKSHVVTNRIIACLGTNKHCGQLFLNIIPCKSYKYRWSECRHGKFLARLFFKLDVIWTSKVFLSFSLLNCYSCIWMCKTKYKLLMWNRQMTCHVIFLLMWNKLNLKRLIVHTIPLIETIKFKLLSKLIYIQSDDA